MNPVISQYTHYEGLTARGIIGRIVIEADVQLQTPAHFGNGDADALTDMPLLVDARDGKSPLLTGASIAGALRSYVTDCVGNNNYVQRLFGPQREAERDQETDAPQSSLIIDDALGVNYGTELRDGVSIDAKTRMAADDHLFSQELWQAGTMFTLRFELLIHINDVDQDELLGHFATALDGLQNGAITLGARKSRGLGRIAVLGWRRKDFDLRTPQGLVEWLVLGTQAISDTAGQDAGNTLSDINLTASAQPSGVLTIDAFFQLRRSLLIRTGGSDAKAPDMVHLTSRFRRTEDKIDIYPILSGTSLTGALRARATKIANTIAARTDDPHTQELIYNMFGVMKGETKLGSRLRVEEHVVQNVQDQLVQNRVSVDRFTGGAKDGALFNQQPLFATPETTVHVKLRLVSRGMNAANDSEIGLLMLLLKDLWTGDLPLGGESSVGRGRLLGKHATLTFTLSKSDPPLVWTITETENGLTITGDADALNHCVAALNIHLGARQ